MSIIKAIVNEGIGVINGAIQRETTVEIVDALSSTRWETSQSELVSKPLYWWNGPKGSIEGVSSGEGQLLKVRVKFAASANATPVKSFCLRCAASDAEDGLKHYLYVYSDGNFASTLANPLEMTFEIPINVSPLVIEPSGSVVDGAIQEALDEVTEGAEDYTDSEIALLKEEIEGTYFSSASISDNVLSLSRPDGTSVDINLSQEVYYVFTTSYSQYIF